MGMGNAKRKGDATSRGKATSKVDARRSASAALPVLMLVTAAAFAQDGATPATLDLGTTSITGNQELPKVLYIVPWKTSDLGELVGRPVNTLLDEVLAPIDPEVFERQLDYYTLLEAPAAAPSADAPETRDAKTQEE
jgi:hypothetical protein